MTITLDLWVTTVVAEDSMWSVVHPKRENAIDYLTINRADPKAIQALTADPFVSVKWTGKRDGVAIRCVTEPKRLRLEISTAI